MKFVLIAIAIGLSAAICILECSQKGVLSAITGSVETKTSQPSPPEPIPPSPGRETVSPASAAAPAPAANWLQFYREINGKRLTAEQVVSLIPVGSKVTPGDNTLSVRQKDNIVTVTFRGGIVESVYYYKKR